MNIDWSKVPKNVMVKHKGRGFHGIFREFVKATNSVGITMMDDVYYADARNVTFLDHADIAKYAVPDPDEAMASRLCKHASEHHDKKRDICNADRLISEAMVSLLTPEEIGAAFLAGNTIQYRPIGSDHTAWVTAEGSHNINLGTYEYRVKPPSGCGAYRGEEKRDKIEAKEDPTRRPLGCKTISKDRMRGLYQKYRVEKSDGSPTDPSAEYFVLRLDKNDAWGFACRRAILFLAYDEIIQKMYPKLADDIIARYGEKAPDPQPQYRQFKDAVEAIPFLGRSIWVDSIRQVWFLIETLKRESGKEIGVGYVDWLAKQPDGGNFPRLVRMTFEKAFMVAKFDNGEPFGVKV